MNQLGFEVQIYNTLKERIKREYNLYEDDQCLLDTINGETSLEGTILSVIRDIKRTEAFASGIKFIIADNNARLQRFEQKAERLRKAVASALQETGLKKVESADIAVSQRPGDPSIVITNDTVIPPNYCNVKYTPSKTKIREALEAGIDVSGAEWSNSPPVLTIRTR